MATYAESRATKPRWNTERVFLSLDSIWSRLITAFIVLAIIFLISPLIVVIFTSFSSFAIHFPPREFTFVSYTKIPERMYAAFSTSLRLGAFSVCLAALIALPAALGLVRGWLPGRTVTESFFRSPLQMPGIVIGVAFYQYYVYLLSSFQISLRGQFLGLLIAHVLIITPYMLATMVGRVASLNPAIEEAAYGLGAGFVRTTLQITLPLLRPAIVAGAFLAFLISFDDVTVSLFLASVGVTPLPVEMLGTAEQSLSPILYAAATLTVLFSVAFALTIERIVGLRTVLSA